HFFACFALAFWGQCEITLSTFGFSGPKGHSSGSTVWFGLRIASRLHSHAHAAAGRASGRRMQAAGARKIINLALNYTVILRVLVDATC
ncbi:MAG: hypothetical protein ACRDCT_15630, partial [Shewanella sp.]